MNHNGRLHTQHQIGAFRARTKGFTADFLKSQYAAQVVVEYCNFYAGTPHSARNINNNATIQFFIEQIAVLHSSNYFQTHPLPEVSTYNAMMKSIWQPFTLSVAAASMVTVSWNDVHKLIAKLESVSIPETFCDCMDRECKFTAFTDLFFQQLHKIKQTVNLTGNPSANQLNRFVLEPLLEKAGLSADEAVQCNGFLHWFLSLFGCEDQIPSFVNVRSCLQLWMEQPSFKHEFIKPNSVLGLHLLCTLVGKEIPAKKFVSWESIPRFHNLHHHKDEIAKVDAVVNVMQASAAQINMDPMYLARNAAQIVHMMGWHVEPSVPTRKTPFQLALVRFEAIVEADKKAMQIAFEEEQKRKRLERAALLSEQCKALYEEMKARVKEDRTCINCDLHFVFAYPLGKEAGCQNPDVKVGEIDPWTLCEVCTSLLCPLCKKQMGNSAEEMNAGKCSACPDERCITCRAPVRHQISLVHSLCFSCYDKSVCTKCFQYSPTCRVRGNSKLCQQCITCSVCQDPLPTEQEQQDQMCSICSANLNDF